MRTEDECNRLAQQAITLTFMALSPNPELPLEQYRQKLAELLESNVALPSLSGPEYAELIHEEEDYEDILAELGLIFRVRLSLHIVSTSFSNSAMARIFLWMSRANPFLRFLLPLNV